ncbi:MAG: hypothetical protein JST00_44205 [Deltaproteobacteria bacterium]|nr:hypothetical protein [Deltaproteobacteria bacterium]
MMRAAVAIGLALFTSGLVGCLPQTRVSRVYEGSVRQERYIHPDAYAAFLRGVLAEEAGDAKAALAAYVQAADDDEDDPEVWTRIGEVRCKVDPKDDAADKAFAKALAVDPTYAGALAGKARCALVRNRPADAAAAAALAAAQDPKNVALESLYLRARAASDPSDPKARERAIALTLANCQTPGAWDALIAWGRARRDAELIARGYEGLVRAAPMRSVEAEAATILLLGDDKLALARRVAVSLSDAPRELGVVGPINATVARLAVDEALARGDKATALARATRGHVPLAEVAARALVLEQKDIAAAVASSVADADPGSSGARMVKLALGAGSKPASPELVAHVTDRPPELCALVFADRLAAAASAEVAREWLSKIERTPMPARDPVGAALTKELVARGVLPRKESPTGPHASAEQPLRRD